MKQISLSATGFELSTKRALKRVILDEMNLAVLWTELVAFIPPFAPATGGRGGRLYFSVQPMLRIQFLQQ